MRTALLAMARDDLLLREELARDGSLFEGYHPRMRAVHDANARRLAAILDAHGWPGEPEVGAEAAKAAWLVLQHAIGHPALQRRGLALLQAAVARGAVPPAQAALLEDRVRTLEGRPQRFGTQFDWDERGAFGPLPVEDPAGVDERRRAVGLGPLAADLARHREALARGPERPPEDPTARRRAIERWLRETGWRG